MENTIKANNKEEREMKNGTGKNGDTICAMCGNPVKSIFTDSSHITITKDQNYESGIAKGIGMYCPNCDHMICLSCLPVVSQKSKRNFMGMLFKRSKPKSEIGIADLPAEMMNDAARKTINEKLQAGGSKVVVRKCSVCDKFCGELPVDKQKRFMAFIDKDYLNTTYQEAKEIVEDLQILITRLEARKIFIERVQQLKPALEMILEKTAIPKLKEVIIAAIENGQHDEAKALCNQGTLWSGFMKNKVQWESDLSMIETLMAMNALKTGQKKTIEAPTRTVYVKRA
jgi:hypothetical protein